MQLSGWGKSVLILAALGFRLPAQTPSPKLDCNRIVMVVSGLTSTCEIRESTIDGIGTLLVTNTPNGSVSVYAWDGPQTIVRSAVLAAAGNDFQAQYIASQIQVVVSSGEVKITGPSSNMFQNWSVNLEIYVPAATALRITTINGAISVRDVAGPIVATTVNGGVDIKKAAGNVTAATVNGAVVVSAATPWNSQTISAKSVNGSVDVTVPADCSAHVNLSTVHGNLSSTITGVIWATKGLHGGLSFDLGSGGPPISATTVNGNVAIHRAD